MMNLLLTFAAALSALLHIRAEYFGPHVQVYVFKPLTMVLIIAMAVRAFRPAFSRYGWTILAGLVFSIAGDVFLMLPSDQFIPGLVCFLIAHLCYITAFRSGMKFAFSWKELIPFVLYGALMTAFLFPFLGEMKVPVFVYTAVIVTMGWQACSRWIRLKSLSSRLAFIGAVLFMVSDSALAVDRFHGHFAAAPALLLVTYFAAQWFIARSINDASPQ